MVSRPCWEDAPLSASIVGCTTSNPGILVWHLLFLPHSGQSTLYQHACLQPALSMQAVAHAAVESPHNVPEEVTQQQLSQGAAKILAGCQEWDIPLQTI